MTLQCPDSSPGSVPEVEPGFLRQRSEQLVAGQPPSPHLTIIDVGQSLALGTQLVDPGNQGLAAMGTAADAGRPTLAHSVGVLGACSGTPW